MGIVSNNVGAWLGATLVALPTVFSDKIIGRIRFRLNCADLRAKYFEELALDLSSYIFWAEVYNERFQKGWTSDPEDLSVLAGELNVAMVTWRKKEYVYRSWVRRYWGPAAAGEFGDLVNAVKSVDLATHAFNDPGEIPEKTAALGKELDTLRTKAEDWLSRTDA